MRQVDEHYKACVERCKGGWAAVCDERCKQSY